MSMLPNVPSETAAFMRRQLRNAKARRQRAHYDSRAYELADYQVRGWAGVIAALSETQRSDLEAGAKSSKPEIAVALLGGRT